MPGRVRVISSESIESLLPHWPELMELRFYVPLNMKTVSFRDVLCSQSLRFALTKLNLAQQKQTYTVGHKKGANLFFSVTLSKNQRILMPFSLIDLEMKGTCDSMRFNHLT